jgi:hypothetical protein
VLDLEPVDAVLEAVVRVRGQSYAQIARTGVQRVVVSDEDLEAGVEVQGLGNAAGMEAQALGDRLREQQQPVPRLRRVLCRNFPDHHDTI